MNVFVANFTPDGHHRWSKDIGIGYGDVKAVAADAAGHSFITGTFTFTANFGGGPVTSAGGGDIFLVEFGN